MHPKTKFVFGTKILNITDNHKHLSFTFSVNAKWTIHINIICKTASVVISALRKYKYLLNRKYISIFIHPILEYASNVWNGYSLIDKNTIEKVQLD